MPIVDSNPGIAEQTPKVTVAVRELVEFVLRSGDLAGDRLFLPPNRALEGIRGHQRIQRSRPPGYQSEVPLAWEIETPAFTLRIQGRLDGLWAGEGSTRLEEIKTVWGRWDGQPDPLHWAQGKIYAFIYAAQHALNAIEVQLTYLDLESHRLTKFRETFEHAELERFFQEVTHVYLEWAAAQDRWIQRRNRSIEHLAFPFPIRREGQATLMTAVEGALERRERLFAEAPTGIGKTISVLFPAVKALAKGDYDKVFYLTAKTVGRKIAEETVGALRNGGLHLRTLTLTAKDKICFNDGRPCDATECPFALGYYDRLKPAMRAALAEEHLDRRCLEELGRRHQVCPFALALDLAPWTDLIIGDYNYALDPQVALKRFFAEESGDYLFLIDEAHNLVDRGREMFSAELVLEDIRRVRELVQNDLPGCAGWLLRLERQMEKAVQSISPGTTPKRAAASPPVVPANLEFDSLLHDSQTEEISGPVMASPPQAVLRQLEQFARETEVVLARNAPADYRESLLKFYFTVFDFLRTAEMFDERFVCVFEAERNARLRLLCLDPSKLLAAAVDRAKAAVFFSATLTPLSYYREVFGGRPEDILLRLASPFPVEHLRVLIADRIATNYRQRSATHETVARAISQVVRGRTGNYMIFFPSYAYLQAVLTRFQCLEPGLGTIAQSPAMRESEREAFMERFEQEPSRTLVGFVVMGGIFGEGIDLAGDRLVGAVVVGTGLPQVSLERNLIRQFYEQRGAGAGFDFAYTFPGFNRVLQAVGRVIRNETDRGVVLLIDGRFAELRYRQLFPVWWRPRAVRTMEVIGRQAADFWSQWRACETSTS